MNQEYFADGLPDLDGPNQGISFDADTIAQALVNIYQKKYGNGTAPEPTLFEKTKEIFSNAINKGWNSGGTPTTDRNAAFIDALRHNTEVFSAFRTHKMQSDIAAQLLNDKGELKPFSKFLKDVKPYVSHQNRAWLQTEYDTAVLRAHQAADWKQFEDEKDVLPNLEWQPSTSSNPGEDHKPYWFTVLPIEHEFWKKHRPGDRWNCKCRLTNTDKAPTTAPVETFVKDLQPSKGLESNPGTTGEIFSDKHPYFPENCGKCPFNKGVGKLIDLATGRKKDCGDCKVLKNTCGQSKIKQTENNKYNQIVKEESNKIIPEGGRLFSQLPNFVNGELFVSRSDIRNICTHVPGRYKTYALTVLNNLSKLHRVQDNVKPKYISNKGSRFKCFNYYTLELDDKTLFVTVGVDEKGKETLYVIADKIQKEETLNALNHPKRRLRLT